MSHTWKDTKQFREEYDKIYGFTSTWPSSGKWYKKELHKARRQVDKQIIEFELEEIDRVRDGKFCNISREVNWRGW
jgi:hypothetical protein